MKNVIASPSKAQQALELVKEELEVAQKLKQLTCAMLTTLFVYDGTGGFKRPDGENHIHPLLIEWNKEFEQLVGGRIVLGFERFIPDEFMSTKEG